MRKLQKLKLNKLSVEALENREMNQLAGGCNITCGCCCTNGGPSASKDVQAANTKDGKWSDGGYACADPTGCGHYVSGYVYV